MTLQNDVTLSRWQHQGNGYDAGNGCGWLFHWTVSSEPDADLGSSDRGTLAIERDQACTKVERRRVRTQQIRPNCHQIPAFA